MPENGPRIKERWHVVSVLLLLLQLAAFVYGAGKLSGQVEALDDRVERIERQLDAQ